MRRLGLVLLFIGAGPVLAQDRGLGPEAAQLAAQEEVGARLNRRLHVSWDPASGAPDVVRFDPPLPVPAANPERVARKVLNRLARVYGISRLGAPDDGRGRRLVHVETRSIGPWVQVRFAQRVGAAEVEGSDVRVVLSRKKRHAFAVQIAGRLYRDLPTLLPPAPALPAAAPQPELQALGLESKPRRLLTPRSGRWDWALESLEWAEGMPWRVLTAADGTELTRTPGAARGTVHGVVHGDDGKLTTRPLPDLYVMSSGGSGRTGKGGSFRGDEASLPGALSGPYETVRSRAGRHSLSGGRRGSFVLRYPDGDVRTEEVSLFYHLGRARRWLDRLSGLLGGAHRQPVVAYVRDQANNAFASYATATAHGRAGQGQMHFGRISGVSTATDPSIVIHERGHILLYNLGYTSSGDQARGINEAYGDYLAGIVTGNSRVAGRLTVPGIARDMSVRRVWPQHGGEEHEIGWIYAGALWDARGELGARTMDRLAFAAIPLFHTGQSLLQGRDATLTADERLFGGRNADALKKHFENHGIGDDEEGEPPTISADNHGVILKPGDDPVTVTFTATDPDGKRITSLAVNEVAIGKSKPAAITDEDAKLEVTLTHDPAHPGMHRLVGTATDADGQVSALQLFVYVKLAGDHQADHTFTVNVGETRREAIADLIPEKDRPAYEGGNFWLAGAGVGAGAHLRDGHLVLAPRPGDEGIHEFQLRGAHRGGWIDTLTLNIKVHVGEGPYVSLHENGAVVPPSRDLSIHAGTTLDLEASAEWSIQASSGAIPDYGDVAPVVSLALPSPPEGVTFTPESGGWTPQLSHKGRILIATEASQTPRTLSFELVAARNDGLQARRRVRVHVLPAANRAPELTLSSSQGAVAADSTDACKVVLDANGKAELEFSARDPEGKVVVVEVAHDRSRHGVRVIQSERGGVHPEPRVDAPQAAERQEALQLPHAAGQGTVAGKVRVEWQKPDDLPAAPAPDATSFSYKTVATFVVRAFDEEGFPTAKVVEVQAKDAGQPATTGIAEWLDPAPADADGDPAPPDEWSDDWETGNDSDSGDWSDEWEEWGSDDWKEIPVEPVDPPAPPEERRGVIDRLPGR